MHPSEYERRKEHFENILKDYENGPLELACVVKSSGDREEVELAAKVLRDSKFKHTSSDWLKYSKKEINQKEREWVDRTLNRIGLRPDDILTISQAYGTGDVVEAYLKELGRLKNSMQQKKRHTGADDDDDDDDDDQSSSGDSSSDEDEGLEDKKKHVAAKKRKSPAGESATTLSKSDENKKKIKEILLKTQIGRAHV